MTDFDDLLERRNTNSIKWTKYPEDVLPLWVADMDFPSPTPIIDALHAFIDQRTFGYEFPDKKLKRTVANRMERLYGWKIDPEAVVATPGIIAAFNAAAWTVCDPGEGVLIQPPVYPPFFQVSKNAGLASQVAPLAMEVNGQRLRYSIDMETFKAAFHSGGARTRLFLSCNPHNPTGRAFTAAELSEMAEACLSNDVIICSDEIHSELLLGDTKHIPIATLSPEIEDRTITLIAPSKTFNVPGLFCGFAIIPNPELREKFAKATERLVHHVNSISLVAAQVAFSGACDDWLVELRNYLTANRSFFVDYVEKKLPQIRTTVPEATYLAWMDCKALSLPANPFDYFLQEAKVALNKGDEFGPGGEGFVRLNFGTPRSILNEALEKMRAPLEEN